MHISFHIFGWRGKVQRRFWNLLTYVYWWPRHHKVNEVGNDRSRLYFCPTLYRTCSSNPCTFNDSLCFLYLHRFCLGSNIITISPNFILATKVFWMITKFVFEKIWIVQLIYRKTHSKLVLITNNLFIWSNWPTLNKND